MVTFNTTVNSKSGDLAGVHEMVGELERARSLPQRVVFDIKVVLDELLSNIVKYAYDDDVAHEIVVRITATDGAVEIGIEDDGRAFDPFAAPQPDLSLPLAERPVGGLGIHFVRKLMDEIEYKRDGSRNILFLKKSF